MAALLRIARLKHSWQLGLVIALAALARFSTLGVQSFWIDEAYTVGLVRLDLLDMLRTIPSTESTPPLYYLLAWFWARIFGTSEIGLRSLSALIGTATVVVAYLIGREFVSRRAGLVAAGLVAVNPLLFWYSQEARAYPLLILLGGVSVLFFGRSLREQRTGSVWSWAVVSALALATHYFAVFLVVPEAVWLLLRLQRRRLLALPIGFVGAVGLALAPLAWHQHRKDFGLLHLSLATRIVQVPKQFLVGYGAPGRNGFALLAAALAAWGLWLLIRRTSRTERDGASILATMAGTAVVVPVALAAIHIDYLSTKNVVAALLPSLVVLAAGFTTSRAGLVGAAAISVVSLAVVVSVLVNRDLQRTDWRGAARALGPAAGNRAILVVGSFGPYSPVKLYVPGARTLPSSGASVSEIALLGLSDAIRTAALRLPRGFIEVKRKPVQQLFVEVFRAKRKRWLTSARLRRSYFGKFPANRIRILLERAS